LDRYVIYRGREISSEFLMKTFGVSSFNPKASYSAEDIQDEDFHDFLGSLRGSSGLYQLVIIMMNGDPREQQ